MTLTLFLAQLIGLYCLMMGVLMLFRKKVFLTVMDGFYSDEATIFLPGLIASFLGLMMILSHNIWNAGVPAIAVTLVGWVALVKGLWMLYFPNVAILAIDILRVKKLSWVYGIVVIVFGAYLTYVGFAGLA